MQPAVECTRAFRVILRLMILSIAYLYQCPHRKDLHYANKDDVRNMHNRYDPLKDKGITTKSHAHTF